MRVFWISLISVVLAGGCVTSSDPIDPVVNSDASMEFLQPGLRPEVLLFPAYLLMEEYELNQHGRIPESRLIGAGMRTKRALATVRKDYSDALISKGWKISATEIERQSFRLMAEHAEAEIEIRAVQGIGPTELFLLYQPGAAEFDEMFKGTKP